MDGPRFHCKKRDPEDGLIHSEECADPLHGAIYVAEDQTRTKNLTVVNNSFMISWFPKPLDKGCRRQDMRTLDCSISLATYNVSITYNENKTREVDVGITGERDIWPESSPGVLTSVMGYVSTNEPKNRELR